MDGSRIKVGAVSSSAPSLVSTNTDPAPVFGSVITQDPESIPSCSPPPALVSPLSLAPHTSDANDQLLRRSHAHVASASQQPPQPSESQPVPAPLSTESVSAPSITDATSPPASEMEPPEDTESHFPLEPPPLRTADADSVLPMWIFDPGMGLGGKHIRSPTDDLLTSSNADNGSGTESDTDMEASDDESDSGLVSKPCQPDDVAADPDTHSFPLHHGSTVSPTGTTQRKPVRSSSGCRRDSMSEAIDAPTVRVNIVADQISIGSPSSSPPTLSPTPDSSRRGSKSNASDRCQTQTLKSTPGAKSSPKGPRIVGHCTFRPSGMLSLDSRLRVHSLSDRVRDAVAPSFLGPKTPSSSAQSSYYGTPITSKSSSPMSSARSLHLKSILKPFPASSLVVYHYAPLTLIDAMAAQRDPRPMIPKSTRSSAVPAAALQMAPELFQQPWTLTQMLYAVRSPADAPLAWLAAVLDVNTTPAAMEIDRITRWNAYGHIGAPGFNAHHGTDVADSGIDLAEGRRVRASTADFNSASTTSLSVSANCLSSQVNPVRPTSSIAGFQSIDSQSTAAAVTTCSHSRVVHFAPSLVTSVAFIPKANKGKPVKKRSMKHNPVVYALPSGGSQSNLYMDDAELAVCPLVTEVIPIRLENSGSSALDDLFQDDKQENLDPVALWCRGGRDRSILEVRIDLSQLVSSSKSLRVWSIVSPLPKTCAAAEGPESTANMDQSGQHQPSPSAASPSSTAHGGSKSSIVAPAPSPSSSKSTGPSPPDSVSTSENDIAPHGNASATDAQGCATLMGRLRSVAKKWFSNSPSASSLHSSAEVADGGAPAAVQEKRLSASPPSGRNSRRPSKSPSHRSIRSLGSSSQ
ncbi:hypothetical protein BCR44DRAFT_87569, partial [Catenaria anguillulae PL171]